ncbi:MAG: hypothetical protein H6Q69_822 [Firmicutes bacterium]|nr:hypothetical protein [Bacillota bacterium]
MTNEDFQRLVLEKLSNLEQGQRSLDQGQKDILSEIKNLKDADQALLDLVEKTYHETEAISRIEAKTDIVAKRLFENEAEISLLKRAK